MSEPEMIRARIVVREVTRYERVVLMSPGLMASLQAQVSTPEGKSDVAAAMFDGELIDSGTCAVEDELLEVQITPLPPSCQVDSEQQEGEPC